MVIKIRPLFSDAKIRKFIDDKVSRINQAIVSRFQRVGEEFVNNARNTNTYRDITGNLRSSIGYVILRDGIQLFSSFPGAKADGVRKGKATASEVASEFPKGYVLICVAGMDYAASVESRGKDVITSSSKLAEDQLRTAIRNLQSKL